MYDWERKKTIIRQQELEVTYTCRVTECLHGDIVVQTGSKDCRTDLVRKDVSPRIKDKNLLPFLHRPLSPSFLLP